MEVVAKKTKELQTRTLIEGIIPLCLTVIVLIVELVCVKKLGWRGLPDILNILLMVACVGFSAWAGWQFFEMSKVSSDIITYDEEKLTISGELVCAPNEMEDVACEISEESAKGDWGTLRFKVDGNSYTCPLVADVKEVVARLEELGAQVLVVEATEEVKEEAAVAEEATEEIVGENKEN